jgi:endonuclease/exonuclease/phosphatase family metal-dependent hydrolase
MKLIQANIWGGRIDKSLDSFLRREKANFICLQEAVEAPGVAALSITLSELTMGAPYNHIFFSPVFSFNLMNKTAGFGNAILSEQKAVESQTVFTGLEYKESFDFDSDGGNIRNLQHAVYEVGGKKLNILNHHGHHINQHKNGDAETMRQCRMIVDYIATLDGPVILTGDFNLAPHSESLEQINAVLTNLSVKYKLKTTRNQLTYKTEVCDFIFVNEQVKVKDFCASDELISDHKALILEFDV